MQQIEACNDATNKILQYLRHQNKLAVEGLNATGWIDKEKDNDKIAIHYQVI